MSDDGQGVNRVKGEMGRGLRLWWIDRGAALSVVWGHGTDDRPCAGLSVECIALRFGRSEP